MNPIITRFRKAWAAAIGGAAVALPAGFLMDVRDAIITAAGAAVLAGLNTLRAKPNEPPALEAGSSHPGR